MKPDRTFVAEQALRMYALVRTRAALPREDLEYVVERAAKLKDPRLQACIAELIGWSDDDRAELETFIAIAIEVMKHSTISRLREAARTVELRHLTQELQRSRDASPDVGR